MKKVVFVTLEDAEFGFRLAGAAHLVIKEEDTESTLISVMADSETGLLVVDGRLVRGMSEVQMRALEEKWYGILLVLPAPEKPGAEVEDYAVRLIKRAIGYHVRVQP